MLVEVRGMMERGEVSREPEEGDGRGLRERITIGRRERKEVEPAQRKGEGARVSQLTAPPAAEEEDDFFESG